jgi:RimJ/RimL family protein N-acetyltransferase
MFEHTQEAQQNVTALRANANDSRSIWEWRNDEITKQMSITTDSVTWEAHTSWYERSLTNPNRYLYIGYLNDKEKIGMCRFDVDSTTHTAEVSINLNPQFRNKKLSTKMLAEAIKAFRSETDIALTATIKKMNISSIKCFTSIGFVFERDNADYNYYSYRP